MLTARAGPFDEIGYQGFTTDGKSQQMSDTPGEHSHSSLSGATELIKNVIAEEGERMRKHTVECFHHTEKPGLVRDPRLGGAGGNCHADSETLLKHKPGSESTHQCRTAMIDDGEFTLCKPRREWATSAASKSLPWPHMKYFGEHLTGAKSAEQYQHGGRSRLKQLSEAARHGC